MKTQTENFKHWSEDKCNEIIVENKDYTNYFNEQMTFEQMYNMLRLQMEFGESETKVIMASLLKVGAKFR